MTVADMETCSGCLSEVLFSSLREVVGENSFIYEGALICITCRRAHPDVKTRRV